MEDIITRGFSKFLKDTSPAININKLETGLSESKIFKVTLLSTEENYICKVFPTNYEDRIKSSTSIEDFLIQHNYPAPKTLFIEFHFTDQFGLLIQEYVEGETFYQRILSGTVTNELLNNIAINLATLHDLPLSTVWQNPKVPCYNSSDLISIVEKWQPYLELLLEQEKISKDIFKYLTEQNQKLTTSLSDFPPKLCPLHWDYNPQNILLNNNEVAAVLDFEIHRVGDSCAELGIVMYWFKFYDADYLTSIFIESYEKAIQAPVSREKVSRYYLLQLLSAYKYLAKTKPNSTTFTKVKKMLNEASTSDLW